MSVAYCVTEFVASAFNSIHGVIDIEGRWDNSSNFYQSLICVSALARWLVPSPHLSSSPSLTALWTMPASTENANKVTALHQEGQPPLPATP